MSDFFTGRASWGTKIVKLTKIATPTYTIQNCTSSTAATRTSLRAQTRNSASLRPTNRCCTETTLKISSTSGQSHDHGVEKVVDLVYPEDWNSKSIIKLFLCNILTWHPFKDNMWMPEIYMNALAWASLLLICRDDRFSRSCDMLWWIWLYLCWATWSDSSYESKNMKNWGIWRKCPFFSKITPSFKQSISCLYSQYHNIDHLCWYNNSYLHYYCLDWDIWREISPKVETIYRLYRLII
jgi:hypothetical protein